MAGLETQMRHRDREMVPKFLVQAMFGLMLASVALVTYAQWADVPNSGVLQEAPIVAERSLTLSGNDMRVYTLRDGDEVVAISSDPRNGFIGVIGLVIERQRMLEGAGMEAPIRVVTRDNGHTAVIDDATGQVIELIGYGADNVAAFADLVK